MIVLRDAGGIGDIVRIFAILDALAELGPVTFYTDRCYAELCAMCPGVGAGAVKLRLWDPAPARAPRGGITRWGQVTMPYADQAAHDPGEPVIDLFCPALHHELVSRHGPTSDRLACWAAAAGIPCPPRGSVRINPRGSDVAEAVHWASRLRRPLVALSPSSNASIRTYRNGLGVEARTGLVGAVVTELEQWGFTAMVFDTRPLGYKHESISHSIGQQAARLSMCDAFVGPDSGMLHIACSLGIPAVALFGPTDPRLVLAPYTGRIEVLRGEWTSAIRRQIGCARPCYGLPIGGFRPDVCGSRCAVLEAVTESQIVSAVVKLVRRPRQLASRVRRLAPQ